MGGPTTLGVDHEGRVSAGPSTSYFLGNGSVISYDFNPFADVRCVLFESQGRSLCPSSIEKSSRPGRGWDETTREGRSRGVRGT